MIKHKVYSIVTLTNTSVGSGDVSFGMVDNLIQKDPVTFLPVFQSSSIKGALREYMEQSGLFKGDIDIIFGAEENKPGVLKFYDARLLTLPLRATKKVYYNCTSPMTIIDYLYVLEAFCNNKDAESLKQFIGKLEFDATDFIIFTEESGLEIEDYCNYKVVTIDNGLEVLIKKYLEVDPANLAIFSDELFKEICEHSLPVIARNKIGDEGTSENLFYEEVLPRRSRLWFMLGFDENISINNEFEKKLFSDLIQFGANASIGYGVTKISLIGGE
jgi:CRISPR-associated protein Cmr4